LRGGTTITLTASPATGTGEVTAEKLSEAKNIIEQRVNGAGVGEAEITTAGNDHITVAVPGANQDSLVRQVGQTALLYFRIVYDAQVGAAIPTTPAVGTPTTKPTTKPDEAHDEAVAISDGQAEHHPAAVLHADGDAAEPGVDQRAGGRHAHPDPVGRAEQSGSHPAGDTTGRHRL
jgi:preprotein translocase subunit SecD